MRSEQQLIGAKQEQGLECQCYKIVIVPYCKTYDHL